MFADFFRHVLSASLRVFPLHKRHKEETSSRVRISTGGRLSGSANVYHRISPRFTLYPPSLLQSVRSFLGRDDWIDFEVNDVVPMSNPFVDVIDIGCLHQLKTNLQLLIHPTGKILQPLRRHPPVLSEAPVNRQRITIPKPLDNHVKHVQYLNFYGYTKGTKKKRSSGDRSRAVGVMLRSHGRTGNSSCNR